MARGMGGTKWEKPGSLGGRIDFKTKGPQDGQTLKRLSLDEG